MAPSARGAGVAIAALIAAATPTAAQETDRAIADMMDRSGRSVGTVEFTGTPNGVLVDVLIVGLGPGEHAIHIHETGSCTPDFAAAGGHHAPEGGTHGFLSEDGPHAGDLPNLRLGAEGAGTAQHFNARVTLDGETAPLFDDDGSAVIVHEAADTYGADAGAGTRVACGVIEPLA